MRLQKSSSAWQGIYITQSAMFEVCWFFFCISMGNIKLFELNLIANGAKIIEEWYNYESNIKDFHPQPRDIWIELRNILNKKMKKYEAKNTKIKYQKKICEKQANTRNAKTNIKESKKQNIIIVILSLYKCLLYMYYVCSWLIDFDHQRKK